MEQNWILQIYTAKIAPMAPFVNMADISLIMGLFHSDFSVRIQIFRKISILL